MNIKSLLKKNLHGLKIHNTKCNNWLFAVWGVHFTVVSFIMVDYGENAFWPHEIFLLQYREWPLGPAKTICIPALSVSLSPFSSSSAMQHAVHSSVWTRPYQVFRKQLCVKKKRKCKGIYWCGCISSSSSEKMKYNPGRSFWVKQPRLWRLIRINTKQRFTILWGFYNSEKLSQRQSFYPLPQQSKGNQ